MVAARSILLASTLFLTLPVPCSSQQTGEEPQSAGGPAQQDPPASVAQGQEEGQESANDAEPDEADRIDAAEAADVRAAARLLGLEFTDEEIKAMLADLGQARENLRTLREIEIENSELPALFFLPELKQRADPFERSRASRLPIEVGTPPERPEDLEELAFADISTLHRHIVGRTVSCVELTEMFLARLERLDTQLFCVITLTRERALEQAARLDQELADGSCRGLLHGIPWVAKDLLAVRDYPTTWGAAPFRTQEFDENATVVERLDEAGAVLIAKVSLGSLAMGDVWFGGQTRNPWNPEQGSSGSSAGSASAVAAGAAPFAIGSETLGSIISPSQRCGTSALRPSFGRVSRHGAMTLCWSMDKLGPIARSARDAAIVFDIIHGSDPRDPTTVNAPFQPFPVENLEGWKVGYVPSHFENEPGEDGQKRQEDYAAFLDELRALDIELVELELPRFPLGEMLIILGAEAGAAFDSFSRSGLDDELVRQTPDAWPNFFRKAQLITAADYIRANRLRTRLIRDFQASIDDVVALVHPPYAGGILQATNLTGHPTFVAPAGFREDGTPFGICFTGHLFGETDLMSLARAWQQSTKHHEAHPVLD